MPDLRLVPVDLLARAHRRAMRLYGRQVLGYGDPRGHPALREALAALLAARRGLAAGAGEILITRGSQMALDLAGRALLGPGKSVAVEALGYRPAWDALRLTGAELLPVPVDAQGLRIDLLEALVEERNVAAVYVTPHHQYPTTVTMAPGRRMALLDLARRRSIAILEDDYDYEFHYEGRPVLPLAHANRHDSVVYIGTLSKVLAPGLRLGFLCASPPLLERITAIRRLCDRQGDLAMEAGVAAMIADGELQRHAARMRRTYKLRRDALCEELATAFGDRLSFRVPPGGMAIWAEVAPEIDAEAWCRAGADRGVLFSPGSRFAFGDEPPGALRLGFAPLGQGELREAVSRMARALRSLRGGST